MNLDVKKGHKSTSLPKFPKDMQCGDILYKFMIVRTILCDKRDDLTDFKGFASTVSSVDRGKEILRLAYLLIL